MPRISSFFGISIYMYFADHDPPHFHAVLGEDAARFRIDSLEPMDGGFPPRAERMVREWAALHREELRDNWERARRHVALATIDPLT